MLEYLSYDIWFLETWNSLNKMLNNVLNLVKMSTWLE